MSGLLVSIFFFLTALNIAQRLSFKRNCVAASAKECVVYVTFRAWEHIWSTCCVLLSELVSLLQLLKPPLIYVLGGHDKLNPSNTENLAKFPP